MIRTNIETDPLLDWFERSIKPEKMEYKISYLK